MTAALQQADAHAAQFFSALLIDRNADPEGIYAPGRAFVQWYLYHLDREAQRAVAAHMLASRLARTAIVEVDARTGENVHGLLERFAR